MIRKLRLFLKPDAFPGVVRADGSVFLLSNAKVFGVFGTALAIYYIPQHYPEFSHYLCLYLYLGPALSPWALVSAKALPAPLGGLASKDICSSAF
jgi:hypothetical protein